MVKSSVLLSETRGPADAVVPAPTNKMGIQESKMWSISSPYPLSKMVEAETHNKIKTQSGSFSYCLV